MNPGQKRFWCAP